MEFKHLLLFLLFILSSHAKSPRTWTEAQLKKAVKSSTCIGQVLRKLGLRHEGANYAQMIDYIEQYKLDTSHFTRRRPTWSNEEFVHVVKNSRSIRQVIHKLGLHEHSSNYKKIEKLIFEQQLDISHFTGPGWNKGMRFPKKRSITEFLNNSRRITTYNLKIRLFEENLKPQHCEQCGWAQISPDGRLPLELDHIDGNRYNNLFENLRILCPNCHSLTLTHRACNYGRYTKRLTD